MSAAAIMEKRKDIDPVFGKVYKYLDQICLADDIITDHV